MITDPVTCIACLQNIKPRSKRDQQWISNAIELIQHQQKTILNQRKQLSAWVLPNLQISGPSDDARKAGPGVAGSAAL